MKGVVVYDLETCKSADEVEGGWNNLAGMGISCGAAYSYDSDTYGIFDQKNMGDLVDLLNSARVIVGFNIIEFDNRLLRSCGFYLKPESELKSFDLLRLSRRSADSEPYEKGFKLYEHLMACGLMAKLGDGKDAPKLYGEGHFSALHTYCLQDVRCERALFEYSQTNGYVKTKARQDPILIPSVEEFLNG